MNKQPNPIVTIGDVFIDVNEILTIGKPCIVLMTPSRTGEYTEFCIVCRLWTPRGERNVMTKKFNIAEFPHEHQRESHPEAVRMTEQYHHAVKMMDHFADRFANQVLFGR